MAPPPPPALALLLLLLPLVLAVGQVRMPGASTPVLQPDSDPGVQEAERFAQRVFNRYVDYDFYFRGSRLSLQTQVVNVIKYYLKMEMVKTQCRKEKGKELNYTNLQNCTFAPAAEMKKEICDFEIWSELSHIGTRLMDMQCKPS